MNRRDYLIGVSLNILGLSGCLSTTEQFVGESEAIRPTEIGNWKYETGMKVELAMTDKPRIAVDHETSTVIVEGVASHWSSSCGYNDVLPPEYDPNESHLFVEVVERREYPTDGDTVSCGDDIGSTSYRITIEFDEGIPAQIEVKEADIGHVATKET